MGSASSRGTFQRCKLDPAERETHAAHVLLHRHLLALRRADPARLDGAVLNEHAFLIRWFDEERGDRLLLVNLGEDLEMTIAPEPLLAPPRGCRWQQQWSSDECAYGGPGAVDITRSPLWTVPAESAVLLQAS